jgi:hypothetical protein
VSTNPITTPRAYDTFTLDGTVCPGIARIKSGGNREQEWQEQQTPGQTGANIVFRYEKVARITYMVEVWAGTQFDAFAAFLSMLAAGKDRRPVRVYTLLDLRVAHNRIRNVAYWNCGPQEQLEPGKWGFELAFVEKPKRKPMGGPLQAPRNAIEEKIAQLSAENNFLGSTLDVLNAARRAGK